MELKNTLKKIAEGIIGACSLLTVFLFGAEAPLGQETAQNFWWLGCLAVLILNAVILHFLFPEKYSIDNLLKEDPDDKA